MVGRGIDLCIWIVGIFFWRVKLTQCRFPPKAQENPDGQIEIAVQVFFGLEELLPSQVGVNAVKQNQILLNLLLALFRLGVIHALKA